MSQEGILAHRSSHPYEIPKTTRSFPTAQGGCVDCGHMTYDYPYGAWCPCEDCHMGGLFTRTVTEITSTRRPSRLTA